MRFQEPDAQLDQLAHTVIGAAIEVHRELGPGFLEKVYEAALCIELDARSISYDRQYVIGVNYKGHVIGEGQLDILVAKCLIVELKAVETLLPVHTAQLLSYLKTTSYPFRFTHQLQCTDSQTRHQARRYVLISWRSWRLGGSKGF